MRMGSDKVEAAKVAALGDCCDSLEYRLANDLGLEWSDLTAAIVKVHVVREFPTMFLL